MEYKESKIVKQDYQVQRQLWSVYATRNKPVRFINYGREFKILFLGLRSPKFQANKASNFIFV